MSEKDFSGFLSVYYKVYVEAHSDNWVMASITIFFFGLLPH